MNNQGLGSNQLGAYCKNHVFATMVKLLVDVPHR